MNKLSHNEMLKLASKIPADNWKIDGKNGIDYSPTDYEYYLAFASKIIIGQSDLKLDLKRGNLEDKYIFSVKASNRFGEGVMGYYEGLEPKYKKLFDEICEYYINGVNNFKVDALTAIRKFISSH